MGLEEGGGGVQRGPLSSNWSPGVVRGSLGALRCPQWGPRGSKNESGGSPSIWGGGLQRTLGEGGRGSPGVCGGALGS